MAIKIYFSVDIQGCMDKLKIVNLIKTQTFLTYTESF